MGRPPIGKKSMTPAERQRRHRLGLAVAKAEKEQRAERIAKAAVAKVEKEQRVAELVAVGRKAIKAMAPEPQELLGAGRDLLHNAAFQQALKSLIEGLAAQGRKNMVTMSPPTVAQLTHKLERLLADHGIWAGSKR